MNIDYIRELMSYPQLYLKMASVKKVTVPKKISFGKDKEQYFLHYAPKEQKSDKVMIWIHGGGWNSGKPSDFDFVGQCVAREGYHCISIGYRLSPKNKYPCQIEDAAKGYDKALSYLKKRGIDTSKVIVTGPSAGAHLSALICYDKTVQEKYNVDIDHVAGFIGVAGPYCFPKNMSMTLKLLLNQLFNRNYDRKKAEPYSVTEKNHIPMLLIHSRHDGVIDYRMAAAYYKKAKKLGIDCEIYDVIDKANTHSAYSTGMFLYKRSENKALDKMFTWIEKL